MNLLIKKMNISNESYKLLENKHNAELQRADPGVIQFVVVCCLFVIPVFGLLTLLDS